MRAGEGPVALGAGLALGLVWACAVRGEVGAVSSALVCAWYGLSGWLAFLRCIPG